MESKELLDDFAAHCRKYPTERFWQALRNWSGHNFILASSSKESREIVNAAKDTFYWKARDGAR